MAKLDNSSPGRVVILRALQLGDLLCALPAWRALRRALPQAHITLVGLPWAAGFVERFNAYLDSFIEFPGVPAFPEQPARLHLFPAFLAEVQQWEYDLALQMQGSGLVSNTLVSLFGARESAGFFPAGFYPGGHCPDPDRYLQYPEGEPEIRRLLRLVEFLGFPSQGEALEFPLHREDWHSLNAALDEAGRRLPAGGYAVLHPGARSPERRWPVERFAAVGDGLARQGLQVVVTGSAAEAALAAELAARMQAPALNLAGRTDLGALAALLGEARLLVSNDTGLSHLAAALRIPSLVLFCASDPKRWAPLDQDRHRPVLNALQVSAAEVGARALALLDQVPPAPSPRELLYAA